MNKIILSAKKTKQTTDLLKKMSNPKKLLTDIKKNIKNEEPMDFLFDGDWSLFKKILRDNDDDPVGFPINADKIIYLIKTHFQFGNGETKIEPYTRTYIEKIMEEELVKRQIPFKFQYSVESYVLDYYFENEKTKLAIECDGLQYHNPEKDQIRDEFLLLNNNITTLRYSSHAIMGNVSSCVDEIETFIKDNDFVKESFGPSFSFDKHQDKAYRHTAGPALVLAPAGSGKTAILTNRILKLVREENINPSKILALTFTKKAQLEMSARVKSELGEETSKAITFSTFHSIAYKYLFGNVISKKDVVDTKRFFEVTQWIKANKKNYNYTDTKIKSIIDSTKSLDCDKDEVNKLLDLFYEQGKTTQDLILYAFCEELRSNKLFREQLQDTYQYVLVDECQDNNILQNDIAKIIAAPEDNIFFVGDDDQIIYSFSGASEDNLSIIQEYYKPSLYRLRYNYRCRADIVEAAKNIVVSNSTRMIKVITSPEKFNKKNGFVNIEEVHTNKMKEQNIWLLNKIQNNIITETETAILSRSKFSMFNVVAQLVDANIPFYMKEPISLRSNPKAFLIHSLFSFYYIDKKKIPNDLMRVGIRFFLPYITNEYVDTYFCNGEKFSKNFKELSEALGEKEMKKKGWNSFIDSFSRLYHTFNNGESDLSKLIVEVESLVKDRQLSNSDEIQSDFTEYQKFFKEDTNFRVIFEMFKDDKQKTSLNEALENEVFVKLYTIHSSKGKQFKEVIIIGMNEYVFPNKIAIQQKNEEEERRLCYVAFTRAEQKLYLLSDGDKKNKSRFISEYKEPKVVCSLCESDIKEIDSQKCKKCDKNKATKGYFYCKDCIVSCHRCGAEGCKRDLKKCSCDDDKYICTKCEIPCSTDDCKISCPDRLKKCVDCEKKNCSKHRKPCEVCGESFCLGCIEQCKECESFACKKDTITCECCETMCADCYLDDHLSPCSHCKTDKCSSRFETCECGEQRCFDCDTIKCKDNHFVCKKDVLKCNTCSQTICNSHSFTCKQCSKSHCNEHSIICFGCSKDMCSSCYDKKHLVKCHTCPDSHCAKDMVKCECGDLSCVKCAENHCDKCEEILCKNKDNSCSGCNKNLCAEHASKHQKKCSHCSSFVCERTLTDCSCGRKKCIYCEETSCEHCDKTHCVSKISICKCGKRKCSSCKEVQCDHCKNKHCVSTSSKCSCGKPKCSDCNEKHCDLCKGDVCIANACTCEDCGLNVCKKHSISKDGVLICKDPKHHCVKCDDYFVVSTIKTCFGCESTMCIPCLDKDRTNCKSCSFDFCSSCFIGEICEGCHNLKKTNKEQFETDYNVKIDVDKKMVHIGLGKKYFVVRSQSSLFKKSYTIHKYQIN